MHKGFLKTAVLFCALSVALGAFAAHALKSVMSEYSISIFETGVKYQFYHSIALLVSAILYKEFPNKFTVLASRFFIAGIIIFSGSLYVLAHFPAYKILGAITPIGGLLFIAGWITLFISFSSKKS